ncbi:hypothetical protein DVH24_030026 [Malus domestica]|uniref:Uncharacterized protein n=1 Tax=Malus domestica TaxID=3750 RepID=A0A498I088_MALDO|nr:hypothetical protein DVH24_030026 [Malus domestica]
MLKRCAIYASFFISHTPLVNLCPLIFFNSSDPTAENPKSVGAIPFPRIPTRAHPRTPQHPPLPPSPITRNHFPPHCASKNIPRPNDHRPLPRTATVWFSTIFPHPKSKFLKPNKQNPFTLALAAAAQRHIWTPQSFLSILTRKQMGGRRQCIMPSPCTIPPVKRKPTILCRKTQKRKRELIKKKKTPEDEERED